MTFLRWEVRLGILLVTASILIYAAKLLWLGEAENTYHYVFNSLGFLPINALLVTLILSKLINVRARREKLEKLNVVSGTFFSELGTEILGKLALHDAGIEERRKRLMVNNEWTKKQFDRVRKSLADEDWRIKTGELDLANLNELLMSKRDFMVRLLDNPTLLEHQLFTDMLRALFHVAEELAQRPDLEALPESDRDHLANDVNRVYGLIILQWLDHMKYLQSNYPFLFSLVLRTHPFQAHPTPVFT